MKASGSRIILRTLLCLIAALGSDQGLRAQSVYGSLLGWFNTSCYTVAPPFAFGNEPKVSPVLSAQGIDNFDFSLVKKTAITECINPQFRAEFFNLFNIVQFAPPGEQLGA